MADEVPPQDDAPQDDAPIRAVSTPQPAPPGVAPEYGFVVPPPRLSMARMRQQHVALLKRMNAEGDNAGADFLADVAAFQAGVQEAGAAIAGPDERSELQSTINFWATVRIHAGQRPPTMLVCAFDQAAASAAAGGKSPYKGLMPFDERDRDSFFGQYQAIIKLIALVKQQRLLAVTGLSGSGKSSVVRGALIPQLKDGGLSGDGMIDSSRWAYPDPIVPGADPLAALVTAWGPIEKPEDLPRALDARDVPVVLTIDQFEEVFTLAPNAADYAMARDTSRQLYLDALVAAATAGNLRHQVIITMRSEFDSYLKVNKAFSDLFDAGRFVIGAMQAKELRDTIELPAQRLGVGFETGLVSELVNSVLGEPAGLPLLQFTLNELWKRRPEGSPMRMQDYKDLGGNPRVILARRADEIFDGLRVPDYDTLSKRIFLELVTMGSGQEATSRRVKRSALDVVSVARDNVNNVLGIWRDAGLIRISPAGDIGPDSDVEVAHEALVRNWGRLVGWVEDNFAAIRNRHAFRLRAERWKQFPEETLGELALDEARGYERLDPLETEFVAASAAAVEKAKADRARLRRRWFIAAVMMFAAEAAMAANLLYWVFSDDDPPFWLTALAIAVALVTFAYLQFLVADILQESIERMLQRFGVLDAAGLLRWQPRIRNFLRWGSAIGMVFFGLIALVRLDDGKPFDQPVLDAAVASFDADGRLVVKPIDWQEAANAKAVLARVAQSTGIASVECPTAPTVFMVAPNVAMGVIDKPLGKQADATLGNCQIDFSQTGDLDPERHFNVIGWRTGPVLGPTENFDVKYSRVIFLRLEAMNAEGKPPPPPLQLAPAYADPAMDASALGAAVIGYAVTQKGWLATEAQGVATYDLTYAEQPKFRVQFRSRSLSDPSFDGGPLVSLATGDVLGIHIGSNDGNDVGSGWSNVIAITDAFVTTAKAGEIPISVAPKPVADSR